MLRSFMYLVSVAVVGTLLVLCVNPAATSLLMGLAATVPLGCDEEPRFVSDLRSEAPCSGTDEIDAPIVPYGYAARGDGCWMLGGPCGRVTRCWKGPQSSWLRAPRTAIGWFGKKQPVPERDVRDVGNTPTWIADCGGKFQPTLFARVDVTRTAIEVHALLPAPSEDSVRLFTTPFPDPSVPCDPLVTVLRGDVATRTVDVLLTLLCEPDSTAYAVWRLTAPANGSRPAARPTVLFRKHVTDETTFVRPALNGNALLIVDRSATLPTGSLAILGGGTYPLGPTIPRAWWW